MLVKNGVALFAIVLGEDDEQQPIRSWNFSSNLLSEVSMY